MQKALVPRCKELRKIITSHLQVDKILEFSNHMSLVADLVVVEYPPNDFSTGDHLGRLLLSVNGLTKLDLSLKIIRQDSHYSCHQLRFHGCESWVVPGSICGQFFIACCIFYLRSPFEG